MAHHHTDEELSQNLQNIQTRRKAFEAVVGQYGEQLYWQVRRIVLSHDDANDVLQNTFLKAWNALDTFHGDSRLITWLSRIAINESLDFLRRKKKEIPLFSSEDVSIADGLMGDPYFDGDSTQALLHQAVSSLPDMQRTVFELHYFQEMKYTEMSRMLGVSEGSLKASYHIAVRKISEYFKAQD